MDAFHQVSAPGAFTKTGAGIMDTQAITDCARQPGSVSHVILEQEHGARDSMKSAGISMANLVKCRGIVK